MVGQLHFPKCGPNPSAYWWLSAGGWRRGYEDSLVPFLSELCNFFDYML